MENKTIEQQAKELRELIKQYGDDYRLIDDIMIDIKKLIKTILTSERLTQKEKDIIQQYYDLTEEGK